MESSRISMAALPKSIPWGRLSETCFPVVRLGAAARRLLASDGLKLVDQGNLYSAPTPNSNLLLSVPDCHHIHRVQDLASGKRSEVLEKGAGAPRAKGSFA